MLYMKVKYKGKRYNYYFEGEKPKIVELDEKGNEMADSTSTEFEVEDLEQIAVFEADYVHDLREEAKTNREGLATTLSTLGVENTADLEEFMKNHEILKRNQKGEGDEESELVVQLRKIIKEKEDLLVTDREASNKKVIDSNEKWKREKLISQLSRAVAIPKAANPSEVAIILERYVDVDDDGKITVYDDVEHTREKLGNDGKRMNLDDFAKSYYEENPHHLIGHTGGGGGGSEAPGGEKFFQSEEFQKLPPQERIKAVRKHEAAKGKSA
jgi:hypothetical protein